MSDWQLTETYETDEGVVRWARRGSGDPVVLLHGTPFSSAAWRDIAPALAATHEVYVWDMLGYGQSEMRTGQDVSLRKQARVFADLVRHWGLSAPSVIAHDFGGAVALRAHLLHDVSYERLALFNVVALRPWGSPFFRLVRENAAVFEQLPAALHEALVRGYIPAASHPGLSADATERYVAPWLTDAGRAAFYRQIAQADEGVTDEIQSLYPTIRLPVTVCWGTEDTLIPVAKAHELAELIPGAELRLIPGSGHLVQEDAPAQLTAELLRFLGGDASRR